jgi:hypothetical protein
VGLSDVVDGNRPLLAHQLRLLAFAYVLNNPIAFTDSTGKIPDSIRMKMLVMIG